jgi:hypothetical protein
MRASAIASCRAAGPRKSFGTSLQLRLRALLRSPAPGTFPGPGLREERQRTRPRISDRRESHRKAVGLARNSPPRATARPCRMGRHPGRVAWLGPSSCDASSRSTSSSARGAAAECGCSRRSTRRTPRSPSSGASTCPRAPHRWPFPRPTTPRAASAGRGTSTPTLEPNAPPEAPPWIAVRRTPNARPWCRGALQDRPERRRSRARGAVPRLNPPA